MKSYSERQVDQSIANGIITILFSLCVRSFLFLTATSCQKTSDDQLYELSVANALTGERWEEFVDQAERVSEDLRFILDEEGFRSRIERDDKHTFFINAFAFDTILDRAALGAKRMRGLGRVDLDSLVHPSSACRLPNRFVPVRRGEMGGMWTASVYRPWANSAHSIASLDFEFMFYSNRYPSGNIKNTLCCYSLADKTLYPIYKRIAELSPQGMVERTIMEMMAGEDYHVALRHGPAFRDPRLAGVKVSEYKTVGYIELVRRFGDEQGSALFAEMLSEKGESVTRELYSSGGPPAFFWVDGDPHKSPPSQKPTRVDTVFHYYLVEDSLEPGSDSASDTATIAVNRESAVSLGSWTVLGGYRGINDVHVYISDEEAVVQWVSEDSMYGASENHCALKAGVVEFKKLSNENGVIKSMLRMHLDDNRRVDKCSFYMQSDTVRGALIPFLNYSIDKTSEQSIELNRRSPLEPVALPPDWSTSPDDDEHFFEKEGEVVWAVVYRMIE